MFCPYDYDRKCPIHCLRWLTRVLGWEDYAGGGLNMQPRKIRDGIHLMGAIDWDRRLFDALIPLPDGTSYNAYLVKGSEKTALLDTVDPSVSKVLLAQLEDVQRIDYIISHHAEQDHSGSIGLVLDRFPDAKVIATPKGKTYLIDLLHLPEDVFITVDDGESISLGDRKLKFIHTPWVHWPETMVTYLPEERILFTCDFLGSHYATSEMYTGNRPEVRVAAKRYFAEIMMPFRTTIKKNLQKIEDLPFEMIAPSHGPIHDQPRHILSAYHEWSSDQPHNLAIIPYATMHGSTGEMVERLVNALVQQGVKVEPFNMAVTDIGDLAMALVDAATIVIGTSTVLTGAHPNIVYAAYLANALRPKARFASLIGSYNWATKVVDQITGLIPNLKVEVLEPVLCKGMPREDDLLAVDQLAASIADKHRELKLL